MLKWAIAKTVLSAISAAVTAAKAVIAFIDYLSKLQGNPKATAA